jgi:hypothetical protein
MKTSKILHHIDKINHEATPIKVSASILTKSILVTFMLSSLIFLSSCIAFVPVGHEGHGGGREMGRGGGHGGHNDRHYEQRN